MTIEIWRIDLTCKDQPQKMGGWMSISLSTILAFMEKMAQEECEQRDDVDHVSKVTDKVDTRIISRFVLIGKGHYPSLVEYIYRFVEDEETDTEERGKNDASCCPMCGHQPRW